jgi:hypothetical protein
MNPQNQYVVMEKRIFQERNGQVVDDENIRETIANNKMVVEGYVNGKPIYYVKDLSKKVKNKKKKSNKKKNGNKKRKSVRR